MKTKVFYTNNDWTGTIIRLATAIVLLPHGAQKLLGMFGGFGFTGTMEYLTETVHLPWIVAFLVIFIEFFGSLSLMVGLASRIWAILTIILMLGIIMTSHIHNGFFMNWFGNQKGEGFEYYLLVIGLCSAILVNGSGKYSVDQFIAKA